MDIKWVLGLGLAGIALSSCQPASYEECVLQHIKDAKTSAAAHVIRHTCREQFPKQAQRQGETMSIAEAFDLDPEKWRSIRVDEYTIKVAPVDSTTGLADPDAEEAYTIIDKPD